MFLYLKGTGKLSLCFLPEVALSGSSFFPCHDTCCQALSPLEIIIKMVHWQAVPFVTVGDSEIFSVIFLIAAGVFLKLCILIEYLSFLQFSEAVVKKSLLFHFNLSRDEQKSVA